MVHIGMVRVGHVDHDLHARVHDLRCYHNARRTHCSTTIQGEEELAGLRTEWTDRCDSCEIWREFKF